MKTQTQERIELLNRDFFQAFDEACECRDFFSDAFMMLDEEEQKRFPEDIQGLIHHLCNVLKRAENIRSHINDLEAYEGEKRYDRNQIEACLIEARSIRDLLK